MSCYDVNQKQVAPSAADAPVLAPELEAERQYVLTLDLNNIPPNLIRYLHSGSGSVDMLHSGSMACGHTNMWTNRDHAAFTALCRLQFRALNSRVFERVYATLAPRYGDERGTGVVMNLLYLAVRDHIRW